MGREGASSRGGKTVGRAGSLASPWGLYYMGPRSEAFERDCTKWAQVVQPRREIAPVRGK